MSTFFYIINGDITMQFTAKTTQVLEKLLQRTRLGKIEWKSVGYSVRKEYQEWEIKLSYGEDNATMTFHQIHSPSSYEFNYVADAGSKEYNNIQEIVDIKLEPIVEILDSILMDEKSEAGNLTIMDRIRHWWRTH